MRIKNNDVIVSFGFQDINVRGKIIRLDAITKTILSRFGSREEVNKLLLDSIALNGILASNFKFDGSFKLQLNCYNGVIKVALCNSNVLGDINAYLSLDNNKLKEYSKDQKIFFKDLIGEGYILFHLDQKLSKPYQAIVALEGDNLEESANNWFLMSEQIPTYIRLLSENNQAVGIFLQVLPSDGLNEIDQILANEDFNIIKEIACNISKNELFYDNISSLLTKMYGSKGLIIFGAKKLQYKCNCNRENIAKIVANFSEHEVAEIRSENNGKVQIDCAFCGKKYEF